MHAIVRFLILVLALILSAYLLPGVQIDGTWTAIVVALVLSLLNFFVKPLLILFTIPITILTLGLFLLVINAFIVIMADNLIDGFYVDGFWWALLFSLVLSLTTSLLEELIGGRKQEG